MSLTFAVFSSYNYNSSVVVYKTILNVSHTICSTRSSHGTAMTWYVIFPLPNLLTRQQVAAKHVRMRWSDLPLRSLRLWCELPAEFSGNRHKHGNLARSQITQLTSVCACCGLFMLDLRVNNNITSIKLRVFLTSILAL